MCYRDVAAGHVGRRRSDVRVVAVRVVRAALFAPGKGGELLLSNRNSSDHRMPYDVYERSFDARRSRGYVGSQDRVHVLRLASREFRGALEHAELPRRDVVGAMRH